MNDWRPGLEVQMKSQPLTGRGRLQRKSGDGWYISPDPRPGGLQPPEIWASWDDILVIPKEPR